MDNQYVILIDRRDSEKFRQFQNGHFNEPTKEFLKRHSSNFVWGFHKSQISNQQWQEIKENDYVFFSIPKNNFRITGQVQKKITDQKLGQIIFSDDLHSQEIVYFILFDVLCPINLLFHETMSKTNVNTTLAGMYNLKKNVVINNNTSKKQQTPQFFMSEETKKWGESAPQKNISKTTRFVRDHTKVTKLKDLYQNKCQICDYTFEYEKDSFYSEVHHYNPLYANSDDDFDNMIVVCPNHHAEFDHNFIVIDRDGKTILNKQGIKVGEIYFHKGHKLNIKNIQSQLDV